MQMTDLADLAGRLEGVRATESGELVQWRFHGRLVGRQLDDTRVVFRADFDFRDAMLRRFPSTFSVPKRFKKHMMIVADLAAADPGAIEDALGRLGAATRRRMSR